MADGSVRIIAGARGGRRLRVARGVRPTSARAREALFSIWGSAVVGARLLDLFAGSGAVGLEAWSRGASRVVLVESNRRAVRTLAANLRHLGAGRTAVRLVSMTVPAALADPILRQEAPFDLVLADPPYRWTEFEPLLAALEPLMAPAGEAVIEHRTGVATPAAAGGLACFDRRSYGESSFSRYAREEPSGLRDG